MTISIESIRSVNVTRYVTPLREGGSLPAIAEADDGFLYVIKFRGSGQGIKTLIAELIGAELARALKLKVPEIVFAEVDTAFGRTEPDEEIQDLLKASVGLNLGLHYLSGAITYDPAVIQPNALLSSIIVWLDAFIINMDRTAKNTNMLWWKKELWLIDHGASLYFHHNLSDPEKQALQGFPMIRDHVLLPFATAMNEASEFCKEKITSSIINQILDTIPDVWLVISFPELDAASGRNVYRRFLETRLNNADLFLNEVKDARKALI